MTKRANDSKILYQARCAMMHTYGLYTEEKNGTKYKFTYDIGDVSNPLIHSLSTPDNYKIDFTNLDKEFENAVEAYRLCLLYTLKTNPGDTIITNFDKAYLKIGLIGDPKYQPTNPNNTPPTIAGSALALPT